MHIAPADEPLLRVLFWIIRASVRMLAVIMTLVILWGVADVVWVLYGRLIIQVDIVLATALMAIARKVIVLDYNATEVEFVWATAAVALAMSIGYWLIVSRKQERVAAASG